MATPLHPSHRSPANIPCHVRTWSDEKRFIARDPYCKGSLLFFRGVHYSHTHTLLVLLNWLTAHLVISIVGQRPDCVLVLAEWGGGRVHKPWLGEAGCGLSPWQHPCTPAAGGCSGSRSGRSGPAECSHHWSHSQAWSWRTTWSTLNVGL